MEVSIYNIQDDPIGRGGMGQVYLGADPQGNTVAIKEMLAQYVTDPGLRQRFHQEVHILSQLEHPSIVKMYASFEENGNLYLVMEYIEGENLEQYIKRKGAISESEAVRLLMDILSALDYAHQKDYVHRDIKPSNIMIRPNGSVCLLDFGIAKDMKRTGGSGLTTTIGTTIGTVGYMSPEQAEGLSIDHRSDIYSLGCVLFYMLTGQHAVKEKSNEIATRIAIINEPFPKAIDFNAKLSDKIQQILDIATNKNMILRFQSCGEFEAELKKLIGDTSDVTPVNNKEIELSKKLEIIKIEKDNLSEKLIIAEKLWNTSEESKNKHKVAWIILLIITFIMGIVAINLGNKVKSKDSEIGSLNWHLNNLKTKLSKMQDALPFKIDKIEMENFKKGGATINDYGSTLYASNMRYLGPKIYYTSFLESSKSFTIYYKIYNPNGSLNYNASYSTTYTGNGFTGTIYTGSNSMTLPGWGNENTSIYSSGTYRIEIWCNDMCLKTEKFKIN